MPPRPKQQQQARAPAPAPAPVPTPAATPSPSPPEEENPLPAILDKWYPLPPPNPHRTRPCRRRAIVIGNGYWEQETPTSQQKLLNEPKHLSTNWSVIHLARDMNQLLREHYGFNQSEIRWLSDDPDRFHSPQQDEEQQAEAKMALYPSKQNTIRAMKWLTWDARPGDVGFFFWSGHGGQRKGKHSAAESSGYDQFICPTDHKRNGVILDDDIHRYLCSRAPAGYRLNSFIACCYSGSIMDLPYFWDENGKEVEPPATFTAKKKIAAIFKKNVPDPWALAKEENTCAGDIFQFSASSDDETAKGQFVKGRKHLEPDAALALIRALKANPHMSYTQLLKEMHETMRRIYRDHVRYLEDLHGKQIKSLEENHQKQMDWYVKHKNNKKKVERPKPVTKAVEAKKKEMQTALKKAALCKAMLSTGREMNVNVPIYFGFTPEQERSRDENGRIWPPMPQRRQTV